MHEDDVRCLKLLYLGKLEGKKTVEDHRVGKSIVHPRTDYECPEGEQWYRSTLSLTSALDGGAGGQSHAPAALRPGKRPGTRSTRGWVSQEAGLDGYGKSRPHRNSIPGTSTQ